MGRLYKSRTVRSVLREHERQLKVQGSASTVARSGLSVTAEDELTMYGDFIVTGDFTAQGKISNDALTNPVAAVAKYDYVTNFSMPASLTNIRTLSVPVPAGFTQAAVSLTVRVYALNSTAGLDYLYSQANINGFNGLSLPTPVSGSGGSGMNVSTFSIVLTGAGLGSAVVLQIAAQSNFASWAADPSNSADLSASISWYR